MYQLQLLLLLHNFYVVYFRRRSGECIDFRSFRNGEVDGKATQAANTSNTDFITFLKISSHEWGVSGNACTKQGAAYCKSIFEGILIAK